MIALWTDHVIVRKHWLPRLRTLPVGTRPNPELIVMVSKGSLAGAELAVTRRALDGLRAAGVQAFPACATLSAEYGHTYDSWFDVALWSRMAETLAALAKARQPGDARIAIDLEPYWDREPRYPKRGEPAGDNSSDEYRLAAAMAPLIGMIKHEGITPWILPGGLEYPATWHLAMACPDAVLLDESTYNCPADPAHWLRYERRKPAIESLRRGYLPGFFAIALRSQEFQDELRRRGIGDYWVFFRREDQPERFWYADWFRGPPTRAGTELP